MRARAFVLVAIRCPGMCLWADADTLSQSDAGATNPGVIEIFLMNECLA